jgi:hypothetical protein
MKKSNNGGEAKGSNGNVVKALMGFDRDQSKVVPE